MIYIRFKHVVLMDNDLERMRKLAITAYFYAPSRFLLGRTEEKRKTSCHGCRYPESSEPGTPITTEQKLHNN